MKRFEVWIIIAALTGCDYEEAVVTDFQAARFVTPGAETAQLAGGSGSTCVQDSHTGLVWELKTEDEGLHDWRHTYSWFYPDEAHHEVDYRGTQDAGECAGSQCDTWDFVNAVNEQGWCGFTDWRLPIRDEAFSISDLRKAKSPPTLDSAAFPLTHSAEYWTANDYSFQPDSAWTWNYQYGHDRVDWKKAPKFVRLVRGVPSNLTEVKE